MATSGNNGGTVWKIISESPVNANSNSNSNSNSNNKTTTKQTLVARCIETRDRYWVNTYAHLYCKTITLVGFDRLSTTVKLPNKVLPRLIEWDSNVLYEVDGKILPQPKDWANILTVGAGDDDGADEDDENYHEMASMAGIESQVASPYVLNSSPTRTNSFDTPTHSSISTLPPTSTTTATSSSSSSSNKKSRNM